MIRKFLLFTAAGVLVGSSPLFATPVAYGQTVSSLSSLAVPAGSTYAGSSSTPFSFLSFNGKTAYSGDIVAAVYEQPSGTYDFYYQVDNTSTSTGKGIVAGNITSLTISDYSGYSTNVNTTSGAPPATYTTPAFVTTSIVAPSNTARTAAPGQFLTFTYGSTKATTLSPGKNSAVFMVQTNATSFNNLGTFAVTGAGATYAGTFQPTPEPGFYGTLAVALSAVILVMRRRSAKGQSAA